MRPHRCFESGSVVLTWTLSFAPSWPCDEATTTEAILSRCCDESLTLSGTCMTNSHLCTRWSPGRGASLKGDDTWAARILGTRHAVTERPRHGGRRAVQVSGNGGTRGSGPPWPGSLGRAYAAGRVTSIDS